MSMTALEQKWAEEAAAKQPELTDAYTRDGELDVEKIDEAVLDRIPKPTGWRIVILPYRGTNKSKGGIVLAGLPHNLLPVELIGLPLTQKPPAGVGDDIDISILYCLDHSSGQFLFTLLEARVDSGNDDIQSGQEPVGNIQLSVPPDIDLSPGQEPEALQFPVNRPDLLYLF